jgi:hypothetical protein
LFPLNFIFTFLILPVIFQQTFGKKETLNIKEDYWKKLFNSIWNVSKVWISDNVSWLISL